MKNNSHLYLAQYFLKLEILGKIVEKMEEHILRSITFFQKLCHLWDNVEKQGKGDRPQMTIQWGTCTLRAG